jgi:hypothetical protein
LNRIPGMRYVPPPGVGVYAPPAPAGAPAETQAHAE